VTVKVGDVFRKDDYFVRVVKIKGDTMACQSRQGTTGRYTASLVWTSKGQVKGWKHYPAGVR
jgi:hypothetical protein